MIEKRCLCCGKILSADTVNDVGGKSNYHPACIKKIFGIKKLPKIELSKKELEKFAAKSVKNGNTVSGVQKKLSLHLDSSGNSPRLTLVGYPSGYILKPESSDFPKLPESEFVVMKLAELWKIKTVPNCLVQMEDGSLAYISKRIDRIDSQKIAMEDFCQLSERLTEDKYKGSYEQCGKVISKYSSMPLADKTDFFNRLLFCFITGNNDMHLKNFSLIETDAGFVLSSAYDLLPVQIVNPEDAEEMALNLNGKKSNLRCGDFFELARNLDVGEKVCEKLVARCVETAGKMDREFVEYFMGELAGEFFTLVERRCRVFGVKRLSK